MRVVESTRSVNKMVVIGARAVSTMGPLPSGRMMDQIRPGGDATPSEPHPGSSRQATNICVDGGWVPVGQMLYGGLPQGVRLSTLRCSACGHKKRAGAKFCEECATQHSR